MTRKKIDGELVATVEVYLGIPYDSFDPLLDPGCKAVQELKKILPDDIHPWSVEGVRKYEEPMSKAAQHVVDVLRGVYLTKREAEALKRRIDMAARL